MEFETEQINGIVLHHLKRGKQQLMTICANYGAKLTHLCFEEQGATIPVLWEPTLSEIKSGAWSKSEILFPFPNRLRDGKFEFDGKAYQFPIDEPINRNAIHGFVKNKPFELKETTIQNDKAKITLQHDFNGELNYYPFPFSLIVIFEYDHQAKTLNTSFEVINTGEGKMPFGLGWHPYFSFNKSLISNVQMKLPDVDLIEMDDRQLPTGKRNPYQTEILDFSTMSMDDAFHIVGLEPIYSITDGQFKLDFEASQELKYLQVFNPENDEGVAVEPMSCNVDVLNNGDGLVTLVPKERWSAQFKIVLSLVD
ncbi:MAG: aldose 1-epimerase [Cyclobacteriaceae bacterium]